MKVTASSILISNVAAPLAVGLRQQNWQLYYNKGDYIAAIKWHAINCPNDYVSTLLIVPRLSVRDSHEIVVEIVTAH